MGLEHTTSAATHLWFLNLMQQEAEAGRLDFDLKQFELTDSGKQLLTEHLNKGFKPTLGDVIYCVGNGLLPFLDPKKLKKALDDKRRRQGRGNCGG